MIEPNIAPSPSNGKRYLATKGKAVLANGYNVIPIIPHTKRPAVDDWTKETTPETLNEWVRNGHARYGLGITTKWNPVVDIDVLDNEVAEAMERFVLLHHNFPLVRIGQAPKRGILFKTDVPFGRLQSNIYTDPQGRKAQVEILGDGQQAVTFHVHPVTRKPYHWRREHSPENTPREELENLTRERALVIIDEFHRMMVEKKWKLDSKAPSLADGGALRGDAAPPDWENKKARIMSQLAAIPTKARENRDTWIKIAGSIKYESEASEEGFELFDNRSEKDDAGNIVGNYGGTRELWDSLKREGDEIICTAGTIDYTAKQYGWKEPEPEPVFEPADLSVASWLTRPLPPTNWLLGELLSTTSRGILIGPTGLGKTNFAMALGFALAEGKDFLHWRGRGKPCRVLYIDGEMPRGLFQQRLRDAVRRAGNIPKTLFAFSNEDFPDMPPLNTKAGQRYIDKVIEKLGGIDFIIFDNIQALIPGDLRDTEAWQSVLPWVRDLTRREIGLLWVHHTGIEKTRGYGDSTREWQLDFVAMMTKFAQAGADIAFELDFKQKARQRTPSNRVDYETIVITLANDEWVSTAAPSRGRKLTSQQQKALDLLKQPMPTREWRESCFNSDVSDAKDDDGRRAGISKILRALKEKRWVVEDGGTGILSRVVNSCPIIEVVDDDFDFESTVKP